ncbi:hypothetical protein LX32DRAFT_294801 [Colletotrichum zoysiae]|uniref:DUF6604 domain-containing protein n=1 Tax=Colletotrichum zoysiae TaxID=1216348 RepID=A0AAD9H3A4_9PEZI|nr:hypothetical protein LX32DRAFT_294801 [Colletotrichum zoysiae]
MSSGWTLVCAHSPAKQTKRTPRSAPNKTFQLYRRYKITERLAFSILSNGDEYQDWTINQLYDRVQQASPMLTTEDRSRVTKCFSQAVELRRIISQHYQDSSIESQIRHDGFISFLEEIIELLKTELSCPRTKKNEGEPPRVNLPSNRYQILETNDTDKPEDHKHSDNINAFNGHVNKIVDQAVDFTPDASLDEVCYLQFLEDIQQRVAQAVNGISRAAAGHISYATASMLSTTLLREIKMIVSQETLFHSSWFETSGHKRLVRIPSLTEPISTGYAYWKELQDCASNMSEDVENMSKPYFELISERQLPTAPVSQLSQEQLRPAISQLRDDQKEGNYSVHDLPLTGIIAVSLRRRIQRQFAPDKASAAHQTPSSLHHRIASQVEKRLVHCNGLLEVLHCMVLPRCQLDVVDKTYSRVSELEKLVKHARDDILLLVHFASLVESIVATLRKVTIHFSGDTCIFAYMCKYAALGGTPVPEALEEAFQDPRFRHSFFAQGDPTSESACITAMKQLIQVSAYCDIIESGGKRNIPISAPTCKSLSDPKRGSLSDSSFMERILYYEGKYTPSLVQRLKTTTVEEALEKEQRSPDTLRIRKCLSAFLCDESLGTRRRSFVTPAIIRTLTVFRLLSS